MTIEQEHIHYIRQRLDEMYNDLHSRILFFTVASGIPSDMFGSNEGIPSFLLEDEEWAVWKPVLSSISSAQIEQLEQNYDVSLPPLYRSYLQSYHLLDLQLANHSTSDASSITCSSFLFPSLATNRGLMEIQVLFDEWRGFIAAEYIPFAIGEDGQGIVCFDAQHRDANGDCPVVWITLDRIPEPSQDPAERRGILQQYMEPIFASFGDMFDTVFRKREHK